MFTMGSLFAKNGAGGHAMRIFCYCGFLIVWLLAPAPIAIADTAPLVAPDATQSPPQPTPGEQGPQFSSASRCDSLLVFLIFLAAYRDRNYVGSATGSKLTIGTGDQDDAISLAPASNMTATDLDVSKIAVPRHRCQRLAHSHTLKIHNWTPPFGR